MENEHWDENEPLAEGLDALPKDSFQFPRPSEELRKSVLDQTERIVRARAHRRRFVLLAVVAAAYLGGITTALLMTEKEVRTETSRPAIVDSSSKEQEKQSIEYLTDPNELVRQSESAPPRERIRLLTQAGDLYLSTQYDVENAFSCYRRALHAMPDSERTKIDSKDTWLLAALKDSRN